MRIPFPGYADTIMTGRERFHLHPFLVQATSYTDWPRAQMRIPFPGHADNY